MSNFSALPTFLFYDYETFGTNPSLDRPAQFAAVRSDADFNIIGEPEIFYCQPANDYLPKPVAVMITGITPQTAHQKGLREADFARRIYDLFTVPNTCVVGYNNIRFDDEVTRNLFYRNFYDPYTWSWKNGNSRLDLLKIIRACHALRPEGVIWPENHNKLPSFRLEDLTHVNGIYHEKAHDAMADVYATVAIAKLIKTAQPRLFNYLFNYRYKKKLMTLIDIEKIKPLVHVSGIFGARRSNISWIAPLAWHPNNRNTLIVVDLIGDITPLLEMNNDVLRKRLYLSKEMLGDKAAVPIKLVHLNKCPVLAQVNTLRPIDIERLGINRKLCLENLSRLRDAPYVRSKAISLFEGAKPPFVSLDNVDAQLYKNFFSKEDRISMDIIPKTDPNKLGSLNVSFMDPRIKKLIFNYRARNYPNTLNEIEQILWLEYRRTIFTPEFLQTYVNELETLFVRYEGDNKKKEHLQALWEYAKKIIHNLGFQKDERSRFMFSVEKCCERISTATGN